MRYIYPRQLAASLPPPGKRPIRRFPICRGGRVASCPSSHQEGPARGRRIGSYRRPPGPVPKRRGQCNSAAPATRDSTPRPVVNAGCAFWRRADRCVSKGGQFRSHPWGIPDEQRLQTRLKGPLIRSGLTVLGPCIQKKPSVRVSSFTSFPPQGGNRYFNGGHGGEISRATKPSTAVATRQPAFQLWAMMVLCSVVKIGALNRDLDSQIFAPARPEKTYCHCRRRFTKKISG